MFCTNKITDSRAIRYLNLNFVIRVFFIKYRQSMTKYNITSGMNNVGITRKDWRENMKHGKKPSKRQCGLIKAFDSRLNVKNWLIERETTEEMRLIHRISGKEKVISK